MRISLEGWTPQQLQDFAQRFPVERKEKKVARGVEVKVAGLLDLPATKHLLRNEKWNHFIHLFQNENHTNKDERKLEKW